MQNRLLEELLRRRQQEQLLQQLGSAATQLNSTTMSLSSSLGGTGTNNSNALSLAGNPLPAAPAPSTAASPILVLELQRRLLNGGGGGLGNTAASGLGLAPAAASLDLSSLLGNNTSASLTAVLGALASGSANNAGSNEDLLRSMAATGILQQHPNLAASLLSSQALNPGGTDAASLLSTLASHGAAPGAASVSPAPAETNSNLAPDRKRDGESAQLWNNAQGVAEQLLNAQGFGGGSDLQLQLQFLQAAKRQRLLTSNNGSNNSPADIQAAASLLHQQQQHQVTTNSTNPAASAVHVLASAAAQMERKQAAVPVMSHPPARGNSFPLPPLQEDSKTKGENATPGMPKLTSFRKAWDNVKSKGMRKEIFLRKLYHCKIVPSSPSSSATPGARRGQAKDAARYE
ncbi:expressed unknown protein [Seminavis robusta]|uniref:Uncharacterized protein n=1 Tax=Seminavis robusta TaxID=568900 RepID=A0A9N8DJL3_9STRA|nr:expressed unknown protein [Seminavis robusta]|eukprot:Sro163_g073400.1 n/a (403) ;mRNA; r:97779-98987